MMNQDAHDIYQACMKGDIESLESLLHGIDVNAGDSYNCRPLHYAAKGGHIEVAKVLIRNSAYVNARDDSGQGPLHWASSKEMIKLLIQAKADIHSVDSRCGATPLHCVVTRSNAEAVIALIEGGADVNAKTKRGATPLHGAANNGNTEAVIALIERGADVNAKTKRGATPLHDAIGCKEHSKIIEILIREGSDIEAVDIDKYTPLHLAALMDKKAAIYTLLMNGANPNVISNSGTTSLDIVKSENIELLKDASVIHKIIASPALDQQEVKIEDKVEIKNLDLLSSILNHNFQLHNKAYKSKAELKHIFDHIKPNSVQQQVELDKIIIQFNKVIESGIDHANQNKIADLKYLAAVSPLAEVLKIISDTTKDEDQKEAELVEVFYSQALNIPEDYRSYITQIFKLNAKMIKKIAQTYPKVAKDLFNVVTCTNEQRDQYKAKIEEAGYDIKEGITITTTKHLISESDITNNADIFSLFPQSTIVELFTSKPSPEGHLSVNTYCNHDQVQVNGQITDYYIEGIS